MADETPRPTSSSSQAGPAPQRTPSQNMRLGAPSQSPGHNHRLSFTESLRGMPPSPRANRHTSMSQGDIQAFLNNPPTAGSPDPRFVGRDWQNIAVGELVDPQDLRFVELDTGIEDATNVRQMHFILAEDSSFANFRCSFWQSLALLY